MAFDRVIKMVFSNPGALGSPLQQDMALRAICLYAGQTSTAIRQDQPWPPRFTGDPDEWGLSVSLELGSTPAADDWAYRDSLTGLMGTFTNYPARSLQAQVYYTKKYPPPDNPEFILMGKFSLDIIRHEPPAPHNWPQFYYEGPIQGAEAVGGFLRFDFWNPLSPRIVDPERDFWLKGILIGLLQHILIFPPDQVFNDTADFGSLHGGIVIHIDVNDARCTGDFMAKVVRTIIALVEDMGAIEADIAIHEGQSILHGFFKIRWDEAVANSGNITAIQ